MPSGRDITIERVYEGMRVELFTARVPEGHTFTVVQDDTHAHLVIGTAEQLEQQGLFSTEVNETVVVTEPDEKPKRKSVARKPAAKKAK